MPAKPERVHGKQVLAYIDGMPTRRIQTIDYNSAFDTETVNELGNPAFVEDVVNNVQTELTLTSLNWGNIDLEALVYEKANVGIVHTVSSGATYFFVATIWQAGKTYPTMCSVGDWLHICRCRGSILGDYFKIKAVTAGAAGAGTLAYRYSIDTTASHIPPFNPEKGDYVMLTNKYTITHSDFDAKYTDLILPYKYSPASSQTMYSVLIPRCAVTNLTYRFDTGGTSETSFTMTGDEERMTLATRRELLCIKPRFTSYANSSVILKIGRGHEAVSSGAKYMVYANSNFAVATDIGLWTSSGGSVRVCATVGSGLNLTSADRYRVFVYRTSPKKGHKYIGNISNAIGKLKRGYFEVYMGLVSTAVKLYRVSGVDLSLPQAREDLYELGTDKKYAQQTSDPFKAEITLTFTRTDLEEYAALLGQDTAFDAGTLTDILMSDLKNVKTGYIQIKLYNNRTTHAAGNLLATYSFSNCNFLGDSTTTPVTGSSNVEFKFSSNSYSLVGTSLPPIYG